MFTFIPLSLEPSTLDHATSLETWRKVFTAPQLTLRSNLKGNFLLHRSPYATPLWRRKLPFRLNLLNHRISYFAISGIITEQRESSELLWLWYQPDIEESRNPFNSYLFWWKFSSLSRILGNLILHYLRLPLPADFRKLWQCRTVEKTHLRETCLRYVGAKKSVVFVPLRKEETRMQNPLNRRKKWSCVNS